MGVSVNGAVLTLLAAGEGEGRFASANRYDVSGDSVVTPLDALQVINFLNRVGASSSLLSATYELEDGWSQFDVDGNGQISPLDALLVINQLNANASPEIVSAQAADTVDSIALLKSKTQLSRGQVVTDLAGSVAVRLK